MKDINTPIVQPIGQVSTDENARTAAAAMEAAGRALLKRQEENIAASFVKLLNDLDVDTPRRESVPQMYQNPSPHRGAITLRSPTEPLYRRFTPEEREWRNPDSDHWMREWIRGKYHKDMACMLLAQERLNELFPYERATLTEGVAAGTGVFATGTGASLIPRPLEAVVMIARDRVAKMRRFATFYTMTAQEHNIPTAAAMTAAMTGESTTAAGSEPTVSQVALIAKKAQATGVVTRELLDDASVNVISIFATRGGAGLGVLEDDQFFRLGTGAGNNVTRINGTSFTETSSGILTFTTDMLRMYYAVGQQYRSSAVWFIAADVLRFLTGVKDGMGRPLYEGLMDSPAPLGDDPTAEGTILRRPVYEVPFSSGEIWFGDPAAAYSIGQRMGITMEVSDQVKFDTDEIMFKITERIAGIPVDHVAAAQYATGITSATNA